MAKRRLTAQEREFRSALRAAEKATAQATYPTLSPNYAVRKYRAVVERGRPSTHKVETNSSIVAFRDYARKSGEALVGFNKLVRSNRAAAVFLAESMTRAREAVKSGDRAQARAIREYAMFHFYDYFEDAPDYEDLSDSWFYYN